MSKIVSQPCSLGDNDVERNNPANAEMALAFAIHDYSQQLLMMSRPALNQTMTGFDQWLRTIEQSIDFYRHKRKNDAQ